MLKKWITDETRVQDYKVDKISSVFEYHQFRVKNGEGNGTRSSTLAWKIPWTEDPGGTQPMGSLRVGHDWATSLWLFTFHALEKEMAPHSSVLAWRVPGTGEPGGLPSMGSHRFGHDWSDLAAAAELRNVTKNLFKEITLFIKYSEGNLTASV